MSSRGGFTVPFSSSPPSTPGSGRQPSDKHDNSYGWFAANPSTTPAGPPPSSARSFTPVGPPPSVFGSSQPGTTLFPTKNTNGPNVLTGPKIDRPDFNAFQSRNGTAAHFASSSLPAQNGQQSYGTDDEYREGEDSEEGHVSKEGSMDVDSQGESELSDGLGARNVHTKEFQSSVAYDWGQHNSSFKDISPRSPKRSRTSGPVSHRPSHRGGLQLRKESAIPAIAKSLAKKIGPPDLDEPVHLIMETEKLVKQLYPQESITQDQEQALEAALHVIPEALCKLWQSCCNQNRLESERTMVIGPSEDEPALHKATFLSSLLLKLHHPRPAKGRQAYIASRAKLVPRPSSSYQIDGKHAHLEPYPKVLLDWLEQQHNPYRTAIMELESFHPNPTANINFWDIVFSTVLRGKLLEVVRILRNSDFKHARTAREDGQAEDGYHGIQLGTITRVINRAIQVLESCPALQNEDWNVTGNDWMLFRKRVIQAISDLAAFAEGHDRDLEPAESTFEAENFGLRSSSTALSRSARRAQSKVPWTIYQNLKAMYGLLLGGTTEIVAFAQDWVEATIGLAAWWNGDEDEEIAVGSLAMTRQSLRRSQAQFARSVDLNPSAAYQRRLAYSFARVTDESEDETFQIDSLNPVEVGLASVFEGNIEGVFDLLLAWSTPITAAVVEIATQAGWFESLPGDGVVDGFSESDLMVLSYGQPKKGLTRDGILVDYAQELFAKGPLKEPELQESELGTDVEGWELSIEILDRLDDTSLANKKVVELLGRLPLDSDRRTDKLIGICRSFGLEGEACSIAERYADSVAEESDKYGTALVYYAHSHNSKKVKDVLDLLISLSVVQSTAFPIKDNLDPNLSILVNNPRELLALIAEQDPKAAELLQFYFGGYATLRKFYDLRDEDVHLQDGEKPTLRPVARKKAAATALLMVVASAADNIQGGLFDEERSAVVQVDVLLALLGEVMVFVNQPTRILSFPQISSILSAIEDLQTVHRRIYAQCQECFQSAIAAAQGTRRPPSPREMMKKSISSLTSSSGFSLVGRSMLNEPSGLATDGGQGLPNGNGKSGSDTQQRGWDWRAGMKEGATGQDLLRILRLNLAREVARAWVGGEQI